MSILIYEVLSMQKVEEMKIVGNTAIRVNEMVFDYNYLVCLLNTAISIYTFSSSRISFDLSVIFVASRPLIVSPSQTIPFSHSTSIPSHVLPIIGKVDKYESVSKQDSLEIFGVGKDQLDDDGAEEIKEEEEELQSLILLNHDYTADVLSNKTQERKPLSDDVLSIFLVHSSKYPSFASTSVILYGKHRYNVFHSSSFSSIRPGSHY